MARSRSVPARLTVTEPTLPPPRRTLRGGRRPAAAAFYALAGAVALLLLGSCSSIGPGASEGGPAARAGGYANVHPDGTEGDPPSFWRWQWERWRSPPPRSQPARVPVQRPDAQALAALKAPTDAVSVTWLGHSAALWRLQGLNILTDPNLGERASPVSFAGPRRETPLPIGLADLPRIDLVLISHNHYDHLDRGTVRALAAQPGGSPLFVVPLGVDRWMAGEGITRVRAMDWWQRFEHPGPLGAVTVHFVPAHHWSSRTPFDRNATLWGGFVVQADVGGAPYSMYFAGDTGYARDFADIGERFGGFDFAQIPVGCYLPRWFMKAQHVNEDEAVRIHQDVRSRLSLGVHWGAFRLCDDPVEAPLDGLPAARQRAGVSDDAFVLMAIGETRVLRRPGPAR